MQKTIRKFDAFGSPVTFNFMGDDVVKSLPGAYLTLIVYTITLYIACQLAFAMVQNDDPTIKNYVMTTLPEKMQEQTINLPEFYGDIGIGFSVEEEYRLFDIPERIGNIKVRIASEINFDKNTLEYTDLRLELCGNNSFI